MQASQAGSRVKREIAQTLLINGLAPYVIYSVLSAHTSSLNALLASAVPPLLQSIWSVVSRRRVDALAALVLLGIVLSVVLAFAGGGPRLLLVRESLVTGTIGVLFLVSLAFPRPLIFYLARELSTGQTPADLAEWQRRWAFADFRRSMRLMTLVWGVGEVIEAIIRTAMAETMTIKNFLAVSPFVQYGILGLLILWTIQYGKAMKRPG